MNRLLTLLTLLLSFSAQAQNLQALFSYKTYYSPENGPYVETYLSVNARSVVFAGNASGKLQGAIEVSFVYSDASGVKHSDKYNLLSPEVADTSNINFSFLDQQRVQLPNGTYKLELTITDKNVPEKPYRISQNFKLEYYNNILAISDVQLIDSYKKTSEPSIISKSGFDLIPYVDNFYPQSMNTLRFYAEIYNTDRVFGESSYLINYFVESSETKRVIENLRGFSRQSAGKVNVVLAEIPISELPSGNYNLVVEARNRENELLAQNSVFFQRSNAARMTVSDDYRQRDVTNTFASYITNTDTLTDYINSMYPISGQLEMMFLNNQLKLADLKLMQQFFYDFWVKRNPINPEKAWQDYRAEVIKVNKDFGNQVRKGYATERGRVYLKYGPPNTISRSYNEPSAYPYEVWHYYKLDNQSNRKFVFYNPDLISNDFVLLHSDAQGEPNNTQWQMMLYKRDTPTRSFDQEQRNVDSFGNKAGDNFANPR